jgi:hypothetical protein
MAPFQDIKAGLRQLYLEDERPILKDDLENQTTRAPR